MGEYSGIHLAILGSFDRGMFSEKITDNVIFIELTENVDDRPMPFAKEINQLVGCQNDLFSMCGPHRHTTIV